MTTVNGQTAVHVRSALNTNPVATALSPQDWYFDPNTVLPLRVEYTVVLTRNILNPEIVAIEFADYRPVSGVLIPFRLTEYGLSGEKDIVTVTSVALNAAISPSDFIFGTGGGQ